MDEPSKLEERFLRELQLRSPRGWRIRRGFVLAFIGLVAAALVASTTVTFVTKDPEYMQPVSSLGVLLVFLLILHYHLGLVQGAVEHHWRVGRDVNRP